MPLIKISWIFPLSLVNANASTLNKPSPHIVYVTFSSMAEAKEIVAKLLDERLIACANLMASQSIYTWQEVVHDQEEIVVIMKTESQHVSRIRPLVKDMHSYDVPCITDWAINGETSYIEWIASVVKPA